MFSSGVVCGVLLSLVGGGLRPTITGTIDTSTVTPGTTIKITYSSPDATSCQFSIHQWGQWIGWSDGIPIPTSGVLQVTPAVPGEFTITIVAAKRRFDLNMDGKFDGRRRTSSISFPIVVTNAPQKREPSTGHLWFDPPVIKKGQTTTRNWTSSGGTAYLDGQRVPPSGSDVLRPQETLQSILQVTRGRRWSWVFIEKATVVVEE